MFAKLFHCKLFMLFKHFYKAMLFTTTNQEYHTQHPTCFQQDPTPYPNYQPTCFQLRIRPTIRSIIRPVSNYVSDPPSDLSSDLFPDYRLFELQSMIKLKRSIHLCLKRLQIVINRTYNRSYYVYCYYNFK